MMTPASLTIVRAGALWDLKSLCAYAHNIELPRAQHSAPARTVPPSIVRQHALIVTKLPAAQCAYAHTSNITISTTRGGRA